MTSRTTFDELEDFFTTIHGDFDAWYARVRTRRAEDDAEKLRRDVESGERALFEHVHRTQKMILALVDVLADRDVIDREAYAAKLSAAMRTPSSSGASKGSTKAVCDGCGAEVTPSNSFLRGDRRLCDACYDGES